MRGQYSHLGVQLGLEGVQERLRVAASTRYLDGVVAPQSLDNAEQVVQTLTGSDAPHIHAALQAQSDHVHVESARLPCQPGLAGFDDPQLSPAQPDQSEKRCTLYRCKGPILTASINSHESPQY